MGHALSLREEGGGLVLCHVMRGMGAARIERRHVKFILHRREVLRAASGATQILNDVRCEGRQGLLPYRRGAVVEDRTAALRGGRREGRCGVTQFGWLPRHEGGYLIGAHHVVDGRGLGSGGPHLNPRVPRNIRNRSPLRCIHNQHPLD